MTPRNRDAWNIAVLFDLENLAIGVREVNYTPFDVELVLDRLLEKGSVIVKKAYADWSNWSPYKQAFREAAVEMIEIPSVRNGGKNGADIKMAVDAMELSYAKPHLDAFALVSGDSERPRGIGKVVVDRDDIGAARAPLDGIIDQCPGPNRVGIGRVEEIPHASGRIDVDQQNRLIAADALHALVEGLDVDIEAFVRHQLRERRGRRRRIGHEKRRSDFGIGVEREAQTHDHDEGEPVGPEDGFGLPEVAPDVAHDKLIERALIHRASAVR
jgi:hypothetical protein